MRTLRVLLYPLAWLFFLITELRNYLFEWGVLRSRVFSVPVICVGNLAVGGTGKTPHTELLLRHFSKKGWRVAVLSRGYGRRTKGFRWVRAESCAQEVGDEPLQMCRKFGNAVTHFAVCENRVRGIQEILTAQPDTQVIVLDDAFQHRYVRAGLNIVLTDCARPYDTDYLLPAGRLREHAHHNQRAQIIVVSRCPATLSDAAAQQLEKRLKSHEQQTVFFTSLTYDNHSSLPHQSVLLITGIAQPAPLLQHLQAQGVTFTHLAFADHHRFDEKDKNKILTLAAQHSHILTTEKDLTRLEDLALPPEVRQKITTINIRPRLLFAQEEAFFKIIDHYVDSHQSHCTVDSPTQQP